MKTAKGFTCNVGAWKAREGMTLIEILVVIAIIGILAGIIMPATMAVRARFKVSATRVEIKGGLEAAMVTYLADWGVYPPDQDVKRGYDSAQCIVYRLGNKFRTGGGSLINSGPYFEFPIDRLVGEIDNDGDGRFGEDPKDGLDNDGDGLFDEDSLEGRYVDVIGERTGVSYYQFDNNEAEDGSEVWGPGNVSNVHPTGVDIWSAGPDGVDKVTTEHPTKDNVTDKDLEDDIGNW